jgi:hypothetical protein
MKFVLVQITKPNQKIYYLNHDPFRSILYTLEDMGHDCVVTRNVFIPGRINIILNPFDIDDETLHKLLTSNIDYVVYQTEILSNEGINNVHLRDGRKITLGGIKELKRYLVLLARSRMIWECFGFNQRFLASKRIMADLIRHGYCPALEGRERTCEPSVDMIFFGSISDYRANILNQIRNLKHSVYVLDMEPPYYRDNQLRNAKLNLSIRFSDHAMNHLPHFRVLTGLYQNRMTLAEYCPEQAWMEDIVMMVPPEDFIQTSLSIIETGEWRDRAVEYKKNFKQMPMEQYIKPLVDELQIRIKGNDYSGQAAIK